MFAFFAIIIPNLPHRLGKTGEGIGEFSLMKEYQPLVQEDFRAIRIEANKPVKVQEALVEFVLPHMDDGQHSQRRKIDRVYRQDRLEVYNCSLP